MLRWLMRLVVVGLIGLGVAYAVSRLMGQDEDFDDFDDIEAGFEFEETPVEIDVPVEAGETSEAKSSKGLSDDSSSKAAADGGAAIETANVGGDKTPSTGTEATEASGASGGNLTDINGIGPNYAARLETAGITNIADLAKASAEDIASKMDVIGGSSAVEDWIAQAKTMTT